MRASAGTIVKKGESRWLIQVSVGYDPKTGKRRRVSKTIRGSKRDAERTRAMMLVDGDELLASKFTFIDVINDYLLSKDGTIRKATLDEYKRLGDIAKSAPFATVPIVRMERKEGDIMAWLDTFAAPWSKKATYKFLRQVFNYAKRQHLIANNVMDYIEEPKAKRNEIKTIPYEDLPAYLEAVRETDIEAGVLLMVYIGLRRGETVARKWSDIVLNDPATVCINSAVRELHGGGLVFDKPKTEKSERTDYIPRPCVERLRAIRKAHKKDEWVCQYEGDVMRPDMFSKTWRACIKKAGLEPVQVKNLRHTCGTILVKELGVSIPDVAELLGHSTTRTTEQFYLQNSDVSKRRVADAWG